MHVGWQAYCDYYRTGKFRWGTPAESVDIMEKLKKANPAPWGITVHTLHPPPNGTDLQLAERFGVASTALTFNYGAIEGEPTLPFTNFGGSAAFTRRRARSARGRGRQCADTLHATAEYVRLCARSSRKGTAIRPRLC